VLDRFASREDVFFVEKDLNECLVFDGKAVQKIGLRPAYLMQGCLHVSNQQT
jgi:hypothetical protein